MENAGQMITRIGLLSCVNAAPIAGQWENSVDCGDWQLFGGSPATLDTMLEKGQIDMGFLSVAAYARYPEKFQILSGLSISACGQASAGFLFSHIPLEQLNGVPVFVDNDSATALGLLHIVLEEFHGVRPVYTLGKVESGAEKGFKALLAAGDDALRILEKSTFLYQYDLVDIWRRETTLPVVLGVFAVREEFCRQREDTVIAVHRELLRCRDAGIADLTAVSDLTAIRIPMAKNRCCEYLAAMEYDLSGTKRKALETFVQYMITRGDGSPQALPLKFFSHLY